MELFGDIHFTGNEKALRLRFAWARTHGSTDCSHASRSNIEAGRQWRNAVCWPPVVVRGQLNISDDMTLARKNAHSSNTVLSDTAWMATGFAIAVQWCSSSERASHVCPGKGKERPFWPLMQKIKKEPAFLMPLCMWVTRMWKSKVETMPEDLRDVSCFQCDPNTNR